MKRSHVVLSAGSLAVVLALGIGWFRSSARYGEPGEAGGALESSALEPSALSGDAKSDAIRRQVARAAAEKRRSADLGALEARVDELDRELSTYPNTEAAREVLHKHRERLDEARKRKYVEEQ